MGCLNDVGVDILGGDEGLLGDLDIGDGVLNNLIGDDGVNGLDLGDGALNNLIGDDGVLNGLDVTDLISDLDLSNLDVADIGDLGLL